MSRANQQSCSGSPDRLEDAAMDHLDEGPPDHLGNDFIGQFWEGWGTTRSFRKHQDPSDTLVLLVVRDRGLHLLNV